MLTSFKEVLLLMGLFITVTRKKGPKILRSSKNRLESILDYIDIDLLIV